MKKSIVIKPETLVAIAEAARIWFKRQNEITKNYFKKEEKEATMLRNKIWDTEWDKDAKLFIDEIPF